MDPTGSDLISLSNVLGLSSLNNAAFQSSHGDVFYAAGCVCVRYNPLTNRQIDFYTGSKPITCMKVSPCGRYLAIGERGHLPSISVWDMRTKETLVKLGGHKHGIGCLTFSPDSNFIVSCGFKYDKQLLVWDWKNNRQRSDRNEVVNIIPTITEPICAGRLANKVHAIDYHESGKYFVTCGDRHLKFWNLEVTSDGTYSVGGKPGSITEALKDGIFMDVICGTGPVSNTVFCTTSNGILCAFHESRLMDKWLQLESASSYALTLFSKGNAPGLLVVGCADGIIRAFDPSSLTYLTTLPLPQALRPHEAELYYPACYGVRMVAGTTKAPAPKLCALYADRSMLVWDIHDVENVVQYRSFLYHRACIWDIALVNSPQNITPPSDGDDKVADNGEMGSPSGTPALPPGTFATCSADGTIRFWNLDRQHQRDSVWRSQFSKEMLHCIEMGDQSLSSTRLDASADVSGSKRKTSKISTGKKGVDTSIDLSSGLPDCELPSSFNAGGAVSTSDSIDKDNNRGGDDSNPVSVSDYTTESVSARCIAVHPLGNQIACGDKKGKVRVFDLRTMRERISMNAHAAEVLTLNYAPVCETVRRGVDDDNNNSDDWDVVIDPNQKSHGDTKRISLLASAGRDRLVHVYDALNEYSHITTLDNHSSSITIVKFTPDGRRLLSCGGDKTMVITKVHGPELSRVKTISSPNGTINGIAVEATNRFAISSGQDKRLNIYNIVNGKHVRSYKSKGITTELYKADIDPSGMFVAVTGFDKTVNIFDFFSGELLCKVGGHAEVVTSVKFTNDGRHILSVGGDGTIMVWRVSDGLVAAMQDRLLELHGEALKKAEKQEARASRMGLPVPSSEATSAPPPPPSSSHAVSEMDTRAEYAGVAPPPPPIVPEASAPVPVVDGKRGLSGAGAGSGPLTFADTVGDIVPTVGQAAAPLAISEGAPGATTASTSSVGSRDAPAPSSAWRMDDSFELFGKKAKVEGNRALNKFTLELTNATSAMSAGTSVLDGSPSPAVGDGDVTGAFLSGKGSKGEEYEEGLEDENIEPLTLTATQRLEDDDVVMQSDEEEEVRRYFGDDPPNSESLADSEIAEQVSESVNSEGGLGKVEILAGGSNHDDELDDGEKEQLAARRLDALEESVSNLEGWLERRLQSERTSVHITPTEVAQSHTSSATDLLDREVEETGNRAGRLSATSENGDPINGDGRAGNGSANLVSKSLTSDYLLKALRRKEQSQRGEEISNEAADTPSSPSSGKGISTSTKKQSTPRASPGARGGTRSAGATPDRVAMMSLGSKRKETAAALALMSVRLRGMGVYDGKATHEVQGDAEDIGQGQNQGQVRSGDDDGGDGSAGGSETTTSATSDSSSAAASSSSPARSPLRGNNSTNYSSSNAGVGSTGRRRRLIKRKPPTGVATSAVTENGEQIASPRREPVPRNRYPDPPRNGINAINVTNSIDMGRKRSNSGASTISSASPPRDSDKLDNSLYSTSLIRESPSSSQDQTKEQGQAEAIKEEVKVLHIPQPHPDSDTDSTISEDLEHKVEMSTERIGEVVSKDDNAAVNTALQGPWDGDVTSPEADAAIARGVIQSLERDRLRNQEDTQQSPLDSVTETQLGSGETARKGTETGIPDSKELLRALEQHKEVLASLEIAKKKALQSYSDLTSLQSNLVRVSAASVNSSSPASMHSHVSNGPPSSLLAALGQADSLLASYRQSLSLPNSAASSVVIDDTTGTPLRGTAASGVSTKHTSMKAGIDRGVGSFPAYAASVTASAESARTALEVPDYPSGSGSGYEHIQEKRSEPRGIHSTKQLHTNKNSSDMNSSSTGDLDELLDRHSDRILSKLMSKLSPQQRDMLSNLRESEGEEEEIS